MGPVPNQKKERFNQFIYSLILRRGVPVVENRIFVSQTFRHESPVEPTDDGRPPSARQGPGLL